MLDDTSQEHGTEFPVPFSLEELKQDILETMMTLLNQARFTFLRDGGTDANLWSLLSSKPIEYAGAYANPDNGSGEMGLSFSDVESIELVRNLVDFYNYGVHGIFDESMTGMDDCEGPGNWASRILYDLHRSAFLTEWTQYRGVNVHASVAKCLFVIELANARLMLEGGREGFYLGNQDSGVLDIRQMSLLAGMTEGSIRTLAGPNRKNALITTKNNVGTGVHIQIDNAKAWLKAKGRYVPIKRTSVRGAEDLTKRKFTSIDEFENAVYERCKYLSLQHGTEIVDSRIQDAGVKFMQHIATREIMRMNLLGEEQLQDVGLMTRLGEALELPKELFALRASEAATVEKLRIIEQTLKQVQQSSNK